MASTRDCRPICLQDCIHLQIRTIYKLRWVQSTVRYEDGTSEVGAWTINWNSNLSTVPFMVTVNSRPADIPGGSLLSFFGIYHQWITTSEGVSAGMGTAQGVPQSNLPGVSTVAVDHTGQVPVLARTYFGLDADAVNRQLIIGTPLGRWVPPLNDCNTFCRIVLETSDPTPAPPGPWDLPAARWVP